MMRLVDRQQQSDRSIGIDDGSVTYLHLDDSIDLADLLANRLFECVLIRLLNTAISSANEWPRSRRLFNQAAS